jgi:glycosyltransferase involved in cell wall biosynthesis
MKTAVPENVLVVSDRMPFGDSECDLLGERLVVELNRHGVLAEFIRLPSRRSALDPIDEMVVRRSIEVWNVDRLIALTFPAYLIAHPHKVIWLAGRESSRDKGPAVGVLEAAKTYGATRSAASRLAERGRKSTVLCAPLIEAQLFRAERPGDYIFVDGRIQSLDCHSLLLAALRDVSGMRAILASVPNTPVDRERLQMLIHELGLAERVEIVSETLSLGQRAQFINHALAVVYFPDLDCVGYGALEAYQAARPVVMISSADIAPEFVQDGVTGLIAEANPASLSSALRRLVTDPKKSARMGAAGYRMAARWPRWDRVVRTLLS